MATVGKNSSLLQWLLTGTEYIDSIIIQDTVKASGQALLKALVHHFSQQYSIHLFLLECSKESWLFDLPRQQLIFHDYYSDPLGWGPVKKSSSTGSLSELTLQSCREMLKEAPGVSVFECLSPLLLQQSGSAVARLLYAIGCHSSLIISLVHTDSHEDHVISQLSHVNSTVISMHPAPNPSHSGNLCSVQHRRKSGKVFKQMEAFTVSLDYSTISSFAYMAPTSLTASTTHTPSQSDPTANLTFDLTLTTKEREDRSNVVLPYTHPHTSVGKGEIFYQPDEADDFDESDPDDDLDI